MEGANYIVEVDLPGVGKKDIRMSTCIRLPKASCFRARLFLYTAYALAMHLQYTPPLKDSGLLLARELHW